MDHWLNNAPGLIFLKELSTWFILNHVSLLFGSKASQNLLGILLASNAELRPNTITCRQKIPTA